MSSSPAQARGGNGHSSATSSGRRSKSVWPLCGLWICLALLYDIYTKPVLSTLPLPLTVSLAQKGIAVLALLLGWVLGIRRMPIFKWKQLRTHRPISLWHMIAHPAELCALLRSNFSFAFLHQTREAEPLVTCLLSWLLLAPAKTRGRIASSATSTQSSSSSSPSSPGAGAGGAGGSGLRYRLLQLFLLGMGWACARQAWEDGRMSGGVLSAFGVATGANVASAMRSIYTTHALDKAEKLRQQSSVRPLSGSKAFALITILSFLLLLPCALIWEGGDMAVCLSSLLGSSSSSDTSRCSWTPSPGSSTQDTAAAAAAAAVELGKDSAPQFVCHLLLSGLLLYWREKVAFLILRKAGPVQFIAATIGRRHGLVVVSGLFAAVMGAGGGEGGGGWIGGQGWAGKYSWVLEGAIQLNLLLGLVAWERSG